MRVFCYTCISPDPLPQRQALCQWFRSWRDAGFDPFIVTPDMRLNLEPRNVNDLTRVVKASGQDEHMWARWKAPKILATNQNYLLVEPIILPAVRIEDMPVVGYEHRSPVVRYDGEGRVIGGRISARVLLTGFMRHGASGWEEFKGQPFTDWDLLMLEYPESPTVGRTSPLDKARTGDLFWNCTQEQLLELRAKRLAT